MVQNTRKLNCWEFMKCGREDGGPNAEEFGICPAAQAASLHGIHEGSNAGRACWVVAGTMCGGEVQGTFARKYDNCSICAFYNNVKEEELSNFKLSAMLLNLL